MRSPNAAVVGTAGAQTLDPRCPSPATSTPWRHLCPMPEPPLALELSALEAEAIALGEHNTANALRGATMLARLGDERGLLNVGAILAAGACVTTRSYILAQASQAILRRVSLASSAVAHAPAEDLATSLADERALTRALRAERGQLEN